MAHNKKIVPNFFVFVFIFLGILAATESKNLPRCDFPLIFNFGDSNSDTTSDFFFANRSSAEKSGVHHGGKPTRMFNGRLIIDFIAKKLKKPYLSAYMDKIATNFSHGANFAVGGSTIGYYDKTFPDLAEELSRFAQFKAQTIRLSAIERKRSKLPKPEDFPKALYTIDIGQNDITRSMYGRNIKEIPEKIRQLSAGIKNLYDEGARTFWIHNTGPVGCLSALQKIRSLYMSGDLDEFGCLISYNKVAKEFNKQLWNKVVELRAELREASITYVDVYTAKYKLFSNAKNLGFSDPLAPCKNENTTCTDTTKYLLWDGVHYTEAANRLVVPDILDGSLSDPPQDITHACYRDVTI